MYLIDKYISFCDSSAGKKICLQCRRPWFDSWVGKIPLDMGAATYSSFLAWRILYSPWGHKGWHKSHVTE